MNNIEKKFYEEVKTEIKEKFKDKLLILPSYNTDRKLYLGQNLCKFDQLFYSLGEIQSHEAIITQDGINFIAEAYGFKQLAELLFENKWFSEDFKSVQEIDKWLKDLKAN